MHSAAYERHFKISRPASGLQMTEEEEDDDMPWACNRLSVCLSQASILNARTD